jgi:hypothetical protein
MRTSRVIKTLLSLAGAMGLGTFCLVILETDPIRSPIKDFATVVAPDEAIASAVYRTEGPVDRDRWRNVIVHFESTPSPELANRYHFLVTHTETGEVGDVEATELWTHQIRGRELLLTGSDWHDQSITVCIVGPRAGQNPPRDQFVAAVSLTQILQQLCEISADRVYLNSEIDPSADAMGPEFARAFNARLLKL